MVTPEIATGLFVLALALVSAILIRVLHRVLYPRRARPPRAPWVPRTPPRSPPKPRILVDGSNVLFWDAESPQIATVFAVVRDLEAQGFRPGVIFDASVGYKIGTRYQDDAELAQRLALPPEDVLVVPKGTVADDFLLRSARDMKVRIVTNDRYRDWAETFPEVRQPGRLIQGAVTRGQVRWTHGVPVPKPAATFRQN